MRCTKDDFISSAEGIAYIWYVYWYGIDSPVVPTYAPWAQPLIEAITAKILKPIESSPGIFSDDPGIEVVFPTDHHLNTPISNQSNDRLLDFFKRVHDNLFTAQDAAPNINAEINAKLPIIQAMNEPPPHGVNREIFARVVPLFMEQLFHDIVLAPYNNDFTPDGDGKAFDNFDGARERFETLCMQELPPPPPVKASFQDTTLHALNH